MGLFNFHLSHLFVQSPLHLMNSADCSASASAGQAPLFFLPVTDTDDRALLLRSLIDRTWHRSHSVTVGHYLRYRQSIFFVATKWPPLQCLGSTAPPQLWQLATTCQLTSSTRFDSFQTSSFFSCTRCTLCLQVQWGYKSQKCYGRH